MHKIDKKIEIGSVELKVAFKETNKLRMLKLKAAFGFVGAGLGKNNVKYQNFQIFSIKGAVVGKIFIGQSTLGIKSN